MIPTKIKNTTVIPQRTTHDGARPRIDWASSL